MQVKIVTVEMASHSRPNKWEEFKYAVLMEEGDTIKDLMQGYFGSSNNLRNLKVLEELHLVQYLLTHNKATVERAISKLREYREK